jgi:flagellar basal-body rod modification protein FlgD
MKTSIDANFYLTQSINNTLAATFIGKEAKLSTNKFQFNGQESQTIGYNLNSRATNVTIKIYNEDGALVKTIENAPANAGDNKLSWDFTDNNGNTVPYDKYKFEVEAVDADSKPISSTKYVLGKIGGVRFTEFGTKLLINGNEYNLSDILEIFEPSSGGN